MQGNVQVWDVETGFDRELLNMNPEGWIQGVTNERCATCHSKSYKVMAIQAMKVLLA